MQQLLISVKFIFTRTVSDLLERVTSIGARLGLTRSEMTHVDIHDLLHIEKEITCGVKVT